MKENLISLQGREFRYLEKKGAGPKLLFLHGLSDFAGQFIPIAYQLPEDWHLLALDQRVHGSRMKAILPLITRMILIILWMPWT